MIELTPEENMALTVALAQAQRGEEVMPVIATLCVLALARITGEYDYLAENQEIERCPCGAPLDSAGNCELDKGYELHRPDAEFIPGTTDD